MGEQLALILTKARSRAKLSLRDVEKETGVSNAYLCQLEAGKIQQPSPYVLHKISATYGVSYRQLFIATGYPLP
jgi:HTH-type transcriptional regulator, competence development regulator